MSNYYMLGGDGKEYGPVSAEQLRQWVAEGRANAQTQVRSVEGGSWVSFGSVPELSAPAGTFSSTLSNPALAGVMAQVTGGGYGGSDASSSIKRMAAVLSAGSGWMKFMAVLLFINAATGTLFSLGFGLVVTWIPLWFGIILWGAANRANAAFATGGESELTEALDKLRFYFKLSGIIAIIVFAICFGIVLLFMAGAISMAHLQPNSFGP